MPWPAVEQDAKTPRHQDNERAGLGRAFGLSKTRRGLALVLVSWRLGVFATAYQCHCIDWGLVAPCSGAFQPSANAVDNSVGKSLKRGLITPRQTVNWLFTPFPYCGIILDVLLSPVLIKQAQGNETNYSRNTHR